MSSIAAYLCRWYDTCEVTRTIFTHSIESLSFPHIENPIDTAGACCATSQT